MKRRLLVTILGLAATTAAFGQGHILISNYLVAPYNQVYWDPNIPVIGNQAVKASQGVMLEVWYGEGVFTQASQLTSHGPAFGILGSGGSENFDPGMGHGPGGYYLTTALLPTWQAGDTFTFQVRVANQSLALFGSSALWTETGAIGGTGLPANYNTYSAGLIVYTPEPSSAALAAVGAVSLVLFRRRK